MAKKIRNLLSEIDKKFKESEEVSKEINLEKGLLILGVLLSIILIIFCAVKGIGVINNLQGKLENAPS